MPFSKSGVFFPLTPKPSPLGRGCPAARRSRCLHASIWSQRGQWFSLSLRAYVGLTPIPWCQEV
jgi:hypothetical protein